MKICLQHVPIESANSVLLMANHWVLVYAMDVDMSCLLVLITFTKATIFYLGCSCVLMNKRKKDEIYISVHNQLAHHQQICRQADTRTDYLNSKFSVSIIFMSSRLFLSRSQHDVYTEANGMQGYQVDCA